MNTSSPNYGPSLTAVRGEPSYAPCSNLIPPEEGSEMLLVRLTDVPDHQAGDEPTKTTNKVVYFGDESIWSDSLRKARSSKARHPASPQSVSAQSMDSNIHYAVPSTLKDQPQDVPQDDLDVKQVETHLLQKKGAFDLPPPDIQRELLDAYFFWLYPLQPILDREQFLNDFHSGAASILLLQALLFVGTTCCDDSIILQHWPSRRSAQAALYKRVKALYDADHEQNRVTIVQVLFLMCFWWGSPTDNKDFSHWLAASIHLAQVMGMHRSTKDSHLSTKDRRLWKRIWWTLYVRDHFDAASVGRPMVINDDDCDVEPLRETDFECDENGTPPPGAGHCIEMTKLAALIGRAVRAGRAGKNNGASDDSLETIDDDLSSWETQLPEQLEYHEEERNPQAKLFASMLMLGLHFCRVVLHRKSFLEPRPNNESTSTASVSAIAVTRIVEGLLIEGLLTRAQVHFLLHQPKPKDDSEGHDQGLSKNPPCPGNMNLSADLMDSTIEVAHGNDMTISLPLFEQDTNSTVDIQPECGVPHPFMSGTLTSENFLDPLMPLDNLDWYDPDITNFAYLNGNAMLWTGTPTLPAEKGSRP
ncbi:hypothetical protein H2200_004806 [Cladophialophora chaetospira]|uniref:Xylanolytic transcriptional activator regulatory domain-containing protein n=1 Tax=Cladophialophora chaetospira TaxID=386627 RepID=A0AA38XDV4_9EURO|nr:hypothetical protein H2200_004806 [Cladophialophora chaetospira]